MDTRTREAIRYLGYGKHAIDNQTFSLVLEAFDELDRIVERRMIYRIFNIHMSGDDRMEIENIKIQSKNLAKNLCGCEKVVLLGATLGVQVDQLMKRYAYTNMAKTVVLQACAAAMLEEYLDDWQENLAQELSVEEYGLRPRFSPGYGDFSIAHQGEILKILDAPKKIGLTMTEGNMLTPLKSVTAVIGLKRNEKSCDRKQSCASCEKTNCAYRRLEE